MSTPLSTSTPADTTAGTSRSVVKSVYAVEQGEGAGARVRRSIGTPALRNLSPFLMLDAFTVGRGAGFPDHPHRGQTTVTYMLDGAVEHEDFMGNRGKLGPGDVQWMTAGKGIMHSEMPYFEDEHSPDAIGMQLWIDLPKEMKFCEPTYQEKKATEIDRVSPAEGVDIVVISGESHGTQGFVRPVGGCWYFDITLSKPGASVFQPLPKGWTAFIYVLSGQVQVNSDPTPHDKHHTLVLSSSPDQDGVLLSNPSSTDATTATDSGTPTRLILIAGQLLDQRVIQYGPFVVNTNQQVQDAFEDFQMGKNGFERAPGWRSEIGKAMR